MDWLLLHAGSTWALLGLIWVVQLLVYPQFERVGEASFKRYHEEHCRRMGWLVAPLMGVETLSALVLLFDPPAGIERGELWLGASLLLLNAASTGLGAVPMHARLGRGFDPHLLKRLISLNWARTLTWSLRALLAARWLA